LTGPAVAEEAVGMQAYGTDGPPCHGRVKSTPEDFEVEEVIAPRDLSDTERPGTFPLYRVEKRSIDTMHMAREMASELKSRVSYGGLKDSKAVAVQYVTPTSLKSKRPERVVRPRFSAALAGWLPRPLTRSSVVANRFRVTIRECCPEVEARIADAMGAALEGRVPNYFGLQRFGTSGARTHLVGRAIVRGEFEMAAMTLLEGGSARVEAAREAFGSGRFEEGTRLLPPGNDVERAVARELGSHPKEWVRALRAVPVRLRRLYVQAYQSYLFNLTLSRAIAGGETISSYTEGDNWAVPSPDGMTLSNTRGVRERPNGPAAPLVQIVGYAYRNYGSRFDGCVEAVLESEEVVASQFYVREMQEVSAEGGFRIPHLLLRDPSWKAEGSEAEVRFTLGKGQYATVLLREVLKPEDPAVSGLA
jgi:tRNA pseudouridine13 synthase